MAWFFARLADRPVQLTSYHLLSHREVFYLPFRVIFIQDNNHTKNMGKGGDASATAGQRAVKLVGDKSEKITWAEVKKHVSWL